jgi:isocitrate dehydrogenase (NAD+)
VVTKSNVVKTTDGLFLSKAKEVAGRFPGISWENWFIDIMTAKLIDPARRSQFRVMVMPNLYGDILTDEAAQMQGGVGTAGAANIGKRYAMFEAIHGSAPRMVTEGRAELADPQSMMRAVVLLLDHIGQGEKAARLDKALDICGIYEKRMVTTGRPGGATAGEFSDYVMETVKDPSLDERWQGFQT